MWNRTAALALAFLGTHALSGVASASTELGAFGGLEATRAWSAVDDTGTGDIGGGFGFGGSLRHVFGSYSIEYGVFHIPYSLREETPENGSLVTRQSYLQVPLIFRYYPKPSFSIGAGYYAARALGSASQTTQADGQPGSTSWVATPGNALFDHGVVLVSGFGFPIPKTRLRLIGDMRYLFGLRNVGSGGISEQYNHLELLAGLSLEL